MKKLKKRVLCRLPIVIVAVGLLSIPLVPSVYGKEKIPNRGEKNIELGDAGDKRSSPKKKIAKKAGAAAAIGIAGKKVKAGAKNIVSKD